MWKTQQEMPAYPGENRRLARSLRRFHAQARNVKVMRQRVRLPPVGLDSELVADKSDRVVPPVGNPLLPGCHWRLPIRGTEPSPSATGTSLICSSARFGRIEP